MKQPLSQLASAEPLPAYPTIWESWVALGWHFVPLGLGLLLAGALYQVPVAGRTGLLFGFSVAARVLLLLWLRRRAGAARWQALQWPRLRRPLLVGGLLLLVVPALAIVLAPQQLLHLPHWSMDNWLAVLATQPALALVAGCVVGPAAEELVFRGILLPGLLHNYRPLVAIAQSALLFGLAHLNPAQALNGFLFGLLMGWLYYRSRSLWLCIGLHCCYNTLAFGIRILKPHLPVIRQSSGGVDWLSYALIWLAAALVLALCLGALVRTQHPKIESRLPLPVGS